MDTPDITFITTGGTIDKVYFDANSEYQVGDSSIEEIMRLANATFRWQRTQVARKDSLELTDDDRAAIAQAVRDCDTAKIVITHGTDTMVQTALALGDVGDKTIVFTGSMQPAALRDSDALFNVGCAVMAVQLQPPGVYVAMNGRVFPADGVQKNLAERRFEAV